MNTAYDIIQSFLAEGLVQRLGGHSDLSIFYVGLIDYQVGRQIQNQLARLRQVGEVEDSIMICEHSPVITLGKRGAAPSSEQAEIFIREGIEVRQTDRGGLMTYHGPGQLMIYPTIDLSARHLGVKAFIGRGLNSLVSLLKTINISATALTEPAGVWVDDKGGKGMAKIAAVGLRIERHISLHGFSLNYTCSLKPFSLFDPCGLQGAKVTSVQNLLGEDTPTRDQLLRQLSENMSAGIDPLETKITRAGLLADMVFIEQQMI
ncbi:MAG: lipoyl(octanoyl) transferase LipB [Deltaproteobacteria bacterium]|nr:lipoyl(octanoyl) transferase LipB [Deltaproteobacteria bacterium]